MTESSAAPAPRPRRRARPWLILVGLLLLVVLAFSAYVGLVFAWSYSEGERAGVLQKFSRKGWLCKTYEGEMAMSIVPGVTPTIWEFSVRDEEVVPELNAALGKRVVLHYTEHKGVPTSCFGATPYYVDSVASVQ
ncbi:MAG: hypothetical protein H0T44_11275 [Gemmatimonadales bacterium]|nr:hypothetical protein [Gemmatimonadales bacterium]